jgi:hypothetical protein
MTSWPTKLEFTAIPLDLLWVDMPSRLLDGVLKMELPSGKLLTLGTKVGETKASSESEEETMNAALRDKSLLVFPNSKLDQKSS